ncbi:MAG: hypothetical protein J5654_10675 [Victivallales bacterium]|nr:hypothetical protein [Victivallales bacterium]
MKRFFVLTMLLASLLALRTTAETLPLKEGWSHLAHSVVEPTGGRDGHECLHVHAELPSCTMQDWEGDAYSKHSSSAFLPITPGQPYFLAVWAKGAADFWLHVWTYEEKDLSTFVLSTSAADYSDRFAILEDGEWHFCVSPLLTFPENAHYAKVVLEVISNLPGTPYLDLRLSDVVFTESAAHPDPRMTVVKPITDRLLTPKAEVLPAQPADVLSFRLARGETSAASFVVEGAPTAPLETLLPKASALESENSGLIPADSLVIRHVATWYTGVPSITIKQPGFRTLTPELLLNDPTLVKACSADRGNYVRLDFPERSYYSYISAELDEQYGLPKKEYFHLDIKEFPVRDSVELQPVRLSPGERRQFWATFHVPEDALPGTYRGTIALTNEGKTCMELPVTVEVLPFDLLPPENYISSIYYKGYLGPNGAIGAGNYPDSKTPEQYLAEMRNLKAHGVDNPPIFLWWRSEDIHYLDECLTLRELAGMDNHTLFLWGSNTGDSERPEDLVQLRESVEKAIAIAHEHGAEEIYFYGIDEARPEVLAREQAAWQVVHDAGGKIYVAVMDLSDSLDTSLDLAVVAGERFTPDEFARAKAKGMKLLSYGHPQGGCVTPETYRRNYGLLLWQWGFDGAMTHAYQCGYGFIWNDFDGLYRDENMTYPTADGVIDTIQWEGYRESVNDLRYLATLQQAIRQAPNTPAAIQAAAFLADLKTADLATRDLDEIRSEMIDFILALHAQR